MASLRCYDNSNVIAFLIKRSFHLYLIKLWWQFFQMFVCGNVVMLRTGRYWPWKTVTVSSHLHMQVQPMWLHRMALVSFRLYKKKIGATWENFLGIWFTAPPNKKFLIRLCTNVLDKEENLSWSGLQWHQSCQMMPNLSYLQQYFSLGTVLSLQNRSGSSSSESCLDIHEVKTELYESVIEIFVNKEMLKK